MGTHRSSRGIPQLGEVRKLKDISSVNEQHMFVISNDVIIPTAVDLMGLPQLEIYSETLYWKGEWGGEERGTRRKRRKSRVRGGRVKMQDKEEEEEDGKSEQEEEEQGERNS